MPLDLEDEECRGRNQKKYNKIVRENDQLTGENLQAIDLLRFQTHKIYDIQEIL